MGVTYITDEKKINTFSSQKIGGKRNYSTLTTYEFYNPLAVLSDTAPLCISQ